MNAESERILKQGNAVVLRQNLVELTGCAPSALVLGQMIYWSQRASRSDGWFWKSAKQLEVELMMLIKRRTISDLLAASVDEEWIERRKGDNPRNRAYWYRLNTRKLQEKLTEWAAAKRNNDGPVEEQPIGNRCQPIGNSRQPIGNSDHTIGASCQCIIEHKAETTRSETVKESDSDSDSNILLPGPEANARRMPAAADGGQSAMPAVMRALHQAYEIVRGRLWVEIESEFAKGRDIEEVFGKTFTLAQTSKEQGYLQEILSFCKQRWPDIDPAVGVAALIRVSFVTKGFQILKFWVSHNRRQPTLRCYLTMSGGGNDAAKRCDILEELAASPRIDLFLPKSIEGDKPSVG